MSKESEFLLLAKDTLSDTVNQKPKREALRFLESLILLYDRHAYKSEQVLLRVHGLEAERVSARIAYWRSLSAHASSLVGGLLGDCES